MSRRGLLTLSMALSVATTTLFPGSSLAAEVPDAPRCNEGWQALEIPAAGGDWQAYDIVSDGQRPLFLLGGAADGPMVLANRGGTWRRVDAGSGEAAALQGGALREDGSAWAVGSDRPARAQMDPIAGQLTRRRWRGRAIKGVPGERVALADVADKGADRAWAVGTKLVRGQTRAYALRWTGSRWQERSPSVGKRQSGLTAVSSTAADDVWAVGWRQQRGGPLRPLIAKVKGSGWDIQQGAEVPAGIAVLTDVRFRSRNDGWAVGYLVPAGESRHEVTLQHWDGRRWRLVSLPWAESISAVPRAIDVDADGRIWIAGTALAEGTGARGFVAHGLGDSWQLDDELLPAAPGSELFSIAATAEGAMAVGVQGSDAVVLASCTVSAPADAGTPGADDDAATSSAASDEVGGSRMLLASKLGPGKARKPVGFEVRDVADAAGLAAVADTTNGLAEDLDGDGWTDVLYWNHTDRPHYLLGGPDGFRDGPEAAFGPLDRHWCTVDDVDANGDADVFCSSGRKRGRGIGRHELSLGPAFDRGGPALDIGGAIDPFGRGRAATFIHLDGDGLPELFVATSADRGDAMPGMNRFYRNLGGRLVPAPEVGLDRSTGGWCAVAADIDGDGDEDLLHCTDQSDDGRIEGLRVYRNEAGDLRERSAQLGLEPRRDIAVIAADLTGDGRVDIAQLNRSKLRISRGTRRGFRTMYEAAVPFATGMAAGDVDGDGALDLYIVTGSARGNEADFLLINEGRGRDFRSVRIPQAGAGSGSGVMALDHDRNGLTDFVVLNGNGRFQGPTQLLASFPAATSD